MLISLVRPPSRLGPLTQTSSSHQPINLCYLAAALQNAGYEVEIVDFEVEPYRVGRILASSPSVVGITGMTPQYGWLKHLCRRIKELSPKTLLISGGPHVSALPQQTLNDITQLDAVVVGEGEETMVDLASQFNAGGGLREIPGLVWRRDGEIITNPLRKLEKDLDNLAFPAREFLSMDLYRRPSTPGIFPVRGRVTELFTIRGCPYHCIFCAAGLTGGPTVRTRSIKKVSEEIKVCREKFRVNHFNIMDEIFTFSPARVENFCQVVAPLRITWNCECRVDQVSPELLKPMARAGCLKINYGVESGSPRILKLLRKGITVEQIEGAFSWSREAGIKRMAFLMIGAHPEECLEDIKLSVGLTRRIKPDFASFAIATPFPGTELYLMMKAENLIENDNWTSFSPYNAFPVWRTRYLSSRQLYRWHKRLHRKFYLRPGYILKKLVSIRSGGELRYWLRAGVATLRYLFLA